jgi:hypothetical protein
MPSSPGLNSGPFHHGLSIVFTFALARCLIAAGASWLRGSAAPARAVDSGVRGSVLATSEQDTEAALAWNTEMIIEEDA